MYFIKKIRWSTKLGVVEVVSLFRNARSGSSPFFVLGSQSKPAKDGSPSTCHVHEILRIRGRATSKCVAVCGCPLAIITNTRNFVGVGLTVRVCVHFSRERSSRVVGRPAKGLLVAWLLLL